MQTITLKYKADKRVRSGYLWIFRNEIYNHKGIKPGELVVVEDYHKKFIGKGYYNPRSFISIRLFTRNPYEEIDSSFFKRRIESAAEYRKKLLPGLSSYRLVYSEGDFLPGLIVDKYENYLAIQTLNLGMELNKKIIVDVLVELFQPAGIYERNDVASRELEGLPLQKGLLYGELPSKIEIVENGLKFKVDIAEGQKTGFYFDQRDNRASLSAFVEGKRVLDGFCGTGAFSIYAASFGAKETLGIDCSSSALSLARENAELNGFSHICSFVEGDMFNELRKLVKQREKFDVIILDPPAFAKSRSDKRDAIKGYKDINLQAFKLLNRGGYLVTSSCSYHMDLETFKQTVNEAAADAGVTARILRTGTQGLDHPILLSVPETNYLKCLTLLVV